MNCRPSSLHKVKVSCKFDFFCDTFDRKIHGLFICVYMAVNIANSWVIRIKKIMCIRQNLIGESRRSRRIIIERGV